MNEDNEMNKLEQQKTSTFSLSSNIKNDKQMDFISLSNEDAKTQSNLTIKLGSYSSNPKMNLYQNQAIDEISSKCLAYKCTNSLINLGEAENVQYQKHPHSEKEIDQTCFNKQQMIKPTHTRVLPPAESALGLRKKPKPISLENMTKSGDLESNPNELMNSMPTLSVAGAGALESVEVQYEFVRNCLSGDFGKSIRMNRVLEQDNLMNWEEARSTPNYQRDKLRLIQSVRIRAWGFLILNSIWLAIIVTTQIQAINLLNIETVDAFSLNLVNSAENFSFVEIAIWVLCISIGIYGVMKFVPYCLQIYQLIVAVSIAVEVIINVLVLNLVPIVIVKCFFLAFFHSLFIFTARMVENVMLLFKEKYLITLIPEITHQTQVQPILPQLESISS